MFGACKFRRERDGHLGNRGGILSAMRSRATAMRCRASMSALANDFILPPGKGSREVLPRVAMGSVIQCAPHVAIVLRQFQDAIHKWHDLFRVPRWRAFNLAQHDGQVNDVGRRLKWPATGGC